MQTPETRLADRLLTGLMADARQAVAVMALRDGMSGDTEARIALRQVLADQLVLTLARLFDPPHFDRDGESDRVSLPHMMMVLEDRTTLGLLVARAGEDVPDPMLADDACCAAAKALQRARVRDRRGRRAESPLSGAIDAIRADRDRRLAHRLMLRPAEGVAAATVRQVLDFAVGQVDLLHEGLVGLPAGLLDTQAVWRGAV